MIKINKFNNKFINKIIRERRDFNFMDYSYIKDIKIYVMPGNLEDLSDRIPASEWKAAGLSNNNYNRLYFPRYNSDFIEFLAQNPQYSRLYIHPTASQDFTCYENAGLYLNENYPEVWNNILNYIPSFGMANSMFNSANSQILTNMGFSNYSSLFPNMQGYYPGYSDRHIHIVTCGDNPHVYLYRAPENDLNGYDADGKMNASDAIYAKIQDNGDLILNRNIKLSMPRMSVARPARYDRYVELHGFLIHENYTQDYKIKSGLDFHLHYIWYHDVSSMSGRHYVYFNQAPDYLENTINFLNLWPIDGGLNQFNPSNFIHGVMTGRRVRSPSVTPDLNPSGADNSNASGGSIYQERSFLSGLAVGLSD